MSTTTPTEFTGIPTLNAEKIDVLKEWYESSLGDCDKACDVDDSLFYAGQTEGFESALHLLYNNVEGLKTQPLIAEAVKASKAPFNKKFIFVAGVIVVVGVVLYDGRLVRKVKAKLNVKKDIPVTHVSNNLYHITDAHPPFQTKQKGSRL